MPIPWGTVEAKDQLFLATVAACDPKVGRNISYASIFREYPHVWLLPIVSSMF